MALKASFRGVEFLTVEHSIITGRRQPSYAVPFADNGARSVDLGRAPRRFKFTACVLGSDYRTQRDRLMAAFEEAGPGVLIHPEFGRLRVIVGDDVTFGESTSEIGKATITFTATEAADQQVQRSKPDATGVVRSSRLAAIDAAKDVFVKKLPFPAVSDFVAAAHVDVLDRALEQMRSINGAINAVLQVPSGFASQIDQLSFQLTDLLATPAKLYDSIADTMRSIAQSTRRVVGPNGLERDVTEVAAALAPLSRTDGTAGSIEAAARSAALLGDGADSIPDLDTAERNEQRDGRAAILQALRGTMLVELADSCLDQRWDSRAAALAVRAQLCTALVDLANLDDTDQALSDALRDCAAALSRFLGAISENMTTYVPATTLPVEVIAYDLYEDPERADEIVARNRIADPGAVPGLSVLEVERA